MTEIQTIEGGQKNVLLIGGPTLKKDKNVFDYLFRQISESTGCRSS